MATRTLQRVDGYPVLPDPMPDDPRHLLELMNDASEFAGTAQGVGAPVFDHGMRLFNLLHAHYQMQISKEIAAAHHGLTGATNTLKVATWWLAGVTVLLGLVELVNIFGHR